MLTASVVLFGNKAIPALNKFSLFYLQIGWLVVLVTVVACAPKHQSTEFVFRTWINNTGWKNNVICFTTGLVNPLYSLGGLDGVTHITEEMPNVSHTTSIAPISYPPPNLTLGNSPPVTPLSPSGSPLASPSPPVLPT